MYNSSHFYKIDNDKKLCLYVYFYIFIYGSVEMEKNIDGITVLVNLDIFMRVGEGVVMQVWDGCRYGLPGSSVGEEYV